MRLWKSTCVAETSESLAFLERRRSRVSWDEGDDRGLRWSEAESGEAAIRGRRALPRLLGDAVLWALRGVSKSIVWRRPCAHQLSVSRVTLWNQRLQPSAGVVAAAEGQTTAGHVGDGGGEQQAEHTAQEDGGVGSFYHSVQDKRHFRAVVVVEDLGVLLSVGQREAGVARDEDGGCTGETGRRHQSTHQDVVFLLWCEQGQNARDSHDHPAPDGGPRGT